MDAFRVRRRDSGMAVWPFGVLPANTLMDFPSKRWGFVGTVHAKLGYVNHDGSEITDPKVLEVARQHGPMIAGVKTRSFETPLDALDAAKKLGEKVTIPAFLFKKHGLDAVVRAIGVIYEVQ